MTSNAILPYINKPGRYLGKEFNSIEKDWNSTEIHMVLAFPDLYEIGMSHLGLQILYHILNNEEYVLAERSFCPDVDAEKMLRTGKQRLCSLESATPLSSFDLLGITLPFELCYTNILTILDLAAIPLLSIERKESDPIVLGGGSCSLNPEPIADYFDAILLGDGEEAIIELAEVLRKCKRKKIGRAETLRQLSRIKGMYIPAYYSPSYMADGRLEKVEATTPEAPAVVMRRVIQDLDNLSHLSSPLVPNAKIVHDRLGIEIARGCTRGCRFCQAGMIYRPVRERNVQQIMTLAREGIAHSGFEELALLSLSTGDHSCIARLLPQLVQTFEDQYVSVSMPSMRVGTLSPAVMEQIKKVRKTGFTLAPEAGSERLRKAINKGITEEDLLQTCQDAFRLGWKAVKLYFMIGLPGETSEDVDAIAQLTAKTSDSSRNIAARRTQVTTSVGTFVPKPHTPFQWEEQLSLEESRRKIGRLKELMPRKGVKFKWHDPEMSFLEGVFSRGDRRLAPLILAAWQHGARLDGWSDHFSMAKWRAAAEDCNIDMEGYLRARTPQEILPWDHLASGVNKEFLAMEMEKSHNHEYTPDCRYHGCQNCGLCDFTTLKPIVHATKDQQAEPISDDNYATVRKPNSPPVGHFKYMVQYTKLGPVSYLGHLEILQLLFRGLRRARIETNYSKGFNPSPKISFGGALPVGLESMAEYFLMDLPAPLEDTVEAATRLNNCLPDGLNITQIDMHSGKIPQSVINSYEVTTASPLSNSDLQIITSFHERSAFVIERSRKGKVKKVDIFPLVRAIHAVSATGLHLQLLSTAGVPGVKVMEILGHLLGWSEQKVLECSIVKTAWQPVEVD